MFVACTSPRTVGFAADGKIAFSPKQRSKEYAPFQLPCGKCLECRLQYGREWAVRCVHEAQMHEKSCFITLTYDDEHLASPKLEYSDFQKFMKKLRHLSNDPIGVFVTGEYGDKTKRPHWHALVFGWSPSDGTPDGKSEIGDQYFASPTLSRVWGKGRCNYGAVTYKSAGYCARYAAKKLVHGHDAEHDFHPISKKSSKHAIGKKWIEKFWPDVFYYGELRLFDGSRTTIPRYYERWFKENLPTEWLRYVTEVKFPNCLEAERKQKIELERFALERIERSARGNFLPALSPNQRRAKVTKAKFEQQLQAFLKL